VNRTEQQAGIDTNTYQLKKIPLGYCTKTKKDARYGRMWVKGACRRVMYEVCTYYLR